MVKAKSSVKRKKSYRKKRVNKNRKIKNRNRKLKNKKSIGFNRAVSRIKNMFSRTVSDAIKIALKSVKSN